LSANLGAHTATATATGLGGSPATFTTTAANITNVTVGGATNVFNPANVTIALNGTVVWTWAASNVLQHNITFAAGGPSNIPDQASGTANRTFAAAGTFNYQCTNHVGMTGSVTVTP
jgi:plastocyanin